MYIYNSDFDKFLYSGLKGGFLIDSDSESLGYFDAVRGSIFYLYLIFDVPRILIKSNQNCINSHTFLEYEFLVIKCLSMINDHTFVRIAG